MKGGVDKMVMEKELLSQDIYFLCFGVVLERFKEDGDLSLGIHAKKQPKPMNCRGCGRSPLATYTQQQRPEVDGWYPSSAFRGFCVVHQS
jgi:hypothetical protein